MELMPDALAKLKKLGWSLFGLQFLALAAWKTFMFSRFSGTFDETIYQQGVFLISRGHFDPVASIKFLPLIRDHATVLVWLLSPLDWIPPTGLYLLTAAVGAVVWAEIIAFNWILFVVKEHFDEFKSNWQPNAICGVGLVLLVANPWTWWSVAWDFHVEELGAPLIIGAAFEFSRRRFGRAWIWVAALALTGDVGSTWILGLCVSAILAGIFQSEFRKRYLQTAGLLFGAGLIEVLGLSALGLSQGSNLNRLYGYLTVAQGRIPPKVTKSSSLVKAVIFHPLRVLHILIDQRIVFFQNLAPTGFIGIMTFWTFGVPAVILIENTLTKNFFFGFPGFQSLPVYTFTPVGISIILVILCLKSNSKHLVIIALCAIFSLNCLAWEFVFLPHLRAQWVLVSSKQASILTTVDSEIPAKDEVVASQGIISRFSFRKYIYTDFFVHDFPIHTKEVWFVLAPAAGIEGSEFLTVEEISKLAGSPYSKLVLFKDGIYVFRFDAPKGMKRLNLTNASKPDAWTSTGIAGKVVKENSPKYWYVASNGKRGYVIDGDYWSEPVGSYQANILLSNNQQVNVEVWDEDSHKLIAREYLTPDPTPHAVSLSFELKQTVQPAVAYSGTGYFQVQWNPILPNPKNRLEIRVFNPGGGQANVFSFSLESSG